MHSVHGFASAVAALTLGAAAMAQSNLDAARAAVFAAERAFARQHGRARLCCIWPASG